MPIVLWITIFIGKRGTNKASYGEIESFSKRNCDSAGIKPRNGEKVSAVKGPVPLTRDGLVILHYRHSFIGR